MAATIAPAFTGPWEVEEDLDLDDLDARQRPTPEHVTRRLWTAKDHKNETLCEDTQFMLDRGYTFDRIAKRVGMPASALEKRLRGRIRPRYSANDNRFIAALEVAITSKEPFTTDELPIPTLPTLAAALVRAAEHAGRIRNVGRGRSIATGSNVTVWQSF